MTCRHLLRNLWTSQLCSGLSNGELLTGLRTGNIHLQNSKGNRKWPNPATRAPIGNDPMPVTTFSRLRHRIQKKKTTLAEVTKHSLTPESTGNE